MSIDETTDDSHAGRIRLTLEIDPLHERKTAYRCDTWIEESSIQMIDRQEGDGMQIFIDRFIVPALYAVLDQFQQPYTTPEDLLDKMTAAGGKLPRSIEFYRQKVEMARKAQLTS